jgi:hypothetical protein
MPDKKGPQFGGLLPASLMHFYFGRPMQFCSGVDTSPNVAVKRHTYVEDGRLLKGATAIGR